MSTEVVDNKVNRSCVRVSAFDVSQHAREIRVLPALGHLRDMAPGEWFNRTEYVRRSVSYVFIVTTNAAVPNADLFSLLSQSLDRFLVQTNHGFLRIANPLVQGKQLFHALHVLSREFRDAPHFFPATASSRGREVPVESVLG